MMVKKEPKDFFNKVFQWYGLQLYEALTTMKDEKIVGKKGWRKYLTATLTPTEGGTIVTLEMRRRYALTIGRDLNNDANNLVSFVSAVTSRE
jgi:hypothetical protein